MPWAELCVERVHPVCAAQLLVPIQNLCPVSGGGCLRYTRQKVGRYKVLSEKARGGALLQML